MKWIDRWYVKSHTNYDKEYTVSRAEDEETWGCSCPAWKFQRHRIRDGICKHIREVKGSLYDDDVSHLPLNDNIRHDDFFTEEEFAL